MGQVGKGYTGRWRRCPFIVLFFQKLKPGAKTSSTAVPKPRRAAAIHVCTPQLKWPSWPALSAFTLLKQ